MNFDRLSISELAPFVESDATAREYVCKNFQRLFGDYDDDIHDARIEAWDDAYHAGKRDGVTKVKDGMQDEFKDRIERAMECLLDKVSCPDELGRKKHQLFELLGEILKSFD